MEDILDSTPPAYPQGLKNKLQVDIWVQSLLFVITFVSLLVVLVTDGNDYIVGGCTFYFGMGAYQLISSLVHLGYRQKSPLYRAYYVQLFIHLFIFLSAFLGGGIASMVALLFLTPLTAIYYFIITIVSYNQMK